MNPSIADFLTNEPAKVPVPARNPEQAEEVGPVVNYLPMPPRKSVRVSVRYRIRSRGLPLPYELDEGIDE